MKAVRNLIITVLLIGNETCKLVIAAPSLCASSEAIIFSCSTAKNKTIALCKDEHSQTLRYLYGRPQHIELSYSSGQGNDSIFFYNRYFRLHVEYTRIAFTVAGYEYSVFRNYDATESLTPKYGVIVSKNGDEEITVACRSQIVDNMTKIVNHLKCDTSSALGCS